MLTERLLNALNEQLKLEFESAHTYLAMAGYCASEDYDGFTQFFKVQAEEESFHAMKVFDYINSKGGRINIKGLDAPDNQYDSILDVFEKALEHERKVTKNIYTLSDIATEEKEHATISFLRWLIDEQVEEEASFDLLIKKLKRAENNNATLFILDEELGKRTFTPPAKE